MKTIQLYKIQQTVIYKVSYVTALALLSAGVCLCRILGFLLSAQKEVRTRKKNHQCFPFQY